MAVSSKKHLQLSVPALQWPEHREEAIAAFTTGDCTFIPGLLPERALALTADETLEILRARFGARIDLALDEDNVDPGAPLSELPAELASPVRHLPSGNWLSHSNMVGVNLRTIGGLWSLVKYTLTLPAAQNAIHILPIWEPGVVDSLYAPASWELNPELFSDELASVRPTLGTTEKQLRAVINLLHATGRTVGMDVIPHTDRYSEMSLGQPSLFEWLRRSNDTIADHRANLHEDVEQAIFQFVLSHGTANGAPCPVSRVELFATLSPAERREILFGAAKDWTGRRQRRIEMVRHLHALGYEPAPATMAPPYRGLVVDRRPEAKTVDENGLEWRDFTIESPQAMSRVFGPLTRYKLYERLDDNAKWQIDFSRPRPEAWDYICRHYQTVQARYGFDFMRGDMSHVQMRADGVPDRIDDFYDILKSVKRAVQTSGAPYFAYFAESFLASRDVMAYGDEVEHLEACEADATLGDLQSTIFGSDTFIRETRKYFDIRRARRVAPSLTVMTADKDDPRFDEFYRDGNLARLFFSLFTGDMPSYMALGFECRDRHDTPAPNEHYTKLFVFQERTGPKATKGPYVWGKNSALFDDIVRMRLYLDSIFPQISGKQSRWLNPPDPTLADRFFAWTHEQGTPTRVFVVNGDPVERSPRFTLPRLETEGRLELEFSTHTSPPTSDMSLACGPCGYRISSLAPGEARAYRLTNDS